MYAGTGFYSLAEASRLVRVPAKSITRWLYGYSYTTTDKHHEKQQHFAALCGRRNTLLIPSQTKSSVSGICLSFVLFGSS